MTLTIKNSPEQNTSGKPGASSQNSENNSGQSSRSNPVCLELGVIIRSLPTEANGLTQPIREEGRTVIVFDNGAVLRSANNLPVGQTVIVSNPNGRDVVCKVVGGRNLPSVKGYVEVEFIEPVPDFWGLHQNADPVAVAAPPVAPVAPLLSREAPVAPPQVSPSAVLLLDTPSKPASVSLGRGPTFEDVPGLVSAPPSTATRETKAQSARPGPEKFAKEASNYNLSEMAAPTSVANWRPPESELPPEKRAIAAMRDALSTAASTPPPSRDFMSKGLMAYDKPRHSSDATIGRTPLIVGAAAFVLAGVGAVIFFMHRGTAPISLAKTDAVSQAPLPEPPAAKSAPQRVQAPQGESGQAATQTKTQAQAVAAEQAQPSAAIAAVPAVVTRAETADPRTEPGNVRRQEENTAVAKQTNLSSPRRPAIPNLKIGAPSAPNQNPANLGEGAAPLTEIASTEAVGGMPPAGLLTSAGKTSSPPAPPAPPDPAPAPVAAAKTVRDAKLISSARPVYPATARQSGIQGNVSVSANIDEYGRVVSAQAISGPMLLRQAAVDAVKQWKYSPSLVDGKPAPSQITVGVEFRLN